MNFTWSLTIIGNTILLGVLLGASSWRRFPIFTFSQTLCVAFSLIMVWAYYSPLVAPDAYQNAWEATDQVCILLGAFSAWELIEHADGKKWFIVAGFLMIAHALITLAEYLPDIYAGPKSSRTTSNILLTLWLAWIIYTQSKGDSQ